ncbi:MAG: hypothetical protein K8U03_18175 [Planctomycetia bacterium]|nr:hypothetical protein [Planctomycetia bacterium]
MVMGVQADEHEPSRVVAYLAAPKRLSLFEQQIASFGPQSIRHKTMDFNYRDENPASSIPRRRLPRDKKNRRSTIRLRADGFNVAPVPHYRGGRIRRMGLEYGS